MTHKARFLWQMPRLILHLDLEVSNVSSSAPDGVLFVVGLKTGEESHCDMQKELGIIQAFSMYV